MEHPQLAIASPELQRPATPGSQVSTSPPASPGESHRASQERDKERKNKRPVIGNYEIAKSLGEGTFAKVKLGVHRITKQKVALKIVDKDKLPDVYSVKNMYRESQIMKLLNHPYIIKLYEIIETKKEIILVLEYAAGGEVLDYIVAHERLKESEAKKFVGEVVDAMIYCHENNVVHRDLKAENLLLDNDMHIKVTDFGLSTVFDANRNLETFCGSPVYCAPELIDGRKYVGPEVDCWALGVIIYAMVVGDLPFASKDINILYDSIGNSKYHLPSYVSDECRDLISKLLVVDPSKRLTMKQVQSHKWMTGIRTSTGFTQVLGDVTSLLMPKSEADIDKDILDRINQATGIPKETIIESVLTKRFDSSAATYTLMVKQKGEAALRTYEQDKLTKKLAALTMQSGPMQKFRERVESEGTPVPRPRFNTETISKHNNDLGNNAAEELPKSKTTPHDLPVGRPEEEEQKTMRPRARTSQHKVNAGSTRNSIIIESPDLLASKRQSTTSTDGSVGSAGSLSPTSGGVRTLRFAFSVSTTTHLTPPELSEHIVKALNHVRTITYHHSQQNEFIFSCVHHTKNGNLLDFEIEICKIPMLNAMYGIKFKRVKGDIWEYKRVCNSLMKLWEDVKTK